MDRLGGHFGSHEPDDPLDAGYDDEETGLETPPSPVGQDERRMQVRAYNHWASLLGDAHFPSIEDLAPDLEDFGPYSVLLDFSLGIEDPAIQHLGDRLAEECGAPERIAKLSDVPSRSLLSRITDHYMQILANQAPIGFEAEFLNQHGHTALYRGILLPYSSDNETIDFIYGVINWKEVADQQTADELLLEIDQALAPEPAYEQPGVETAEMLTAKTETAGNGRESHAGGLAPAALPRPQFGASDADEDEAQDAFADVANGLDWGLEAEGDAAEGAAIDLPIPAEAHDRAPPRMVLDALGNPLGSFAQDGDDAAEEEFAARMPTAADYGLPDWEDEPEDDDVEDVVDPLADESVSDGLAALVSRGVRTKKTVDLSGFDAVADYDVLPEVEPASPIDDAAADGFAEEFADAFVAEPLESSPVFAEDAIEALPDSVAADETADDPVEGLYDCLAAARELAQSAQNTEDRSRKALYGAVSRAYDFSLEAQAHGEEFAELLADSGLTMQDRAPMTPVVKLVFGADYDKTRLTEYAAVLTHAHRLSLERGSLGDFLRAAEGGLKGVVQAERRARRGERGETAAGHDGVRPALARKLRALAPLDLGQIAAEGPEFALVMVRRGSGGELVLLGEVPGDVPLVERAARKLLER